VLVLKLILGSFAVVLACLLLAAGAEQVHAQSKTGGGGGGGNTGGGGGGGNTGGGGGGNSGSSAFGGSSTSSSYGGAGGTTTGSGGNSSNATYGSGSAITGPNYANVLSFGLGGNSSATSSSAGNSSSTSSSLASVANGTSGSGSSSSTTTNAFQSSQATSTVKFGKALYNVTPVSTFTQPTSNSGTASIRSPSTPQTNPSVRVSYVARISGIPERVPMSQVNTEFQASLAQSPELSKPNNRVQLVQDGDMLVLRGVVENTEQSLLAESLAQMTPGVRGVRNELAVRDNTPFGLPSR